MESTPSKKYLGLRLPREVQMKRVRNVMAYELTDLQRQVMTDHYFNKMSVTQIAAARGVNKSTVSRTLKRAREKVQRYLRY